TVEGNLTLQAGSTLGGGTVVNWTNCYPPFSWVREEWAREHGLAGVDGPEWEEHLAAVLGRLGATDTVSDLNGPQQKLRDGGGALESPALLLRSEIGGPAAGAHLRVHPCVAVLGLYGEDLQGWQGPPHALQCDEHANVGDGHGFIVEGVQYTPALTGSAVPWASGAAHKRLMAEVRYG